MFPQGVPHKRGSIPLGSTRCLIGGMQKLFIEDNLNCFHMSTLFHNILHSPDYCCTAQARPSGEPIGTFPTISSVFRSITATKLSRPQAT